MFHSYQTPKQTFKQQPQKIYQQIHQKTLPCKSLSPTQFGQQQMAIIEKDDQIPSTPQKINLYKEVKLLNMPSQGNENSFRGSSQKTLLVSDSPLVQNNKENGSSSRRLYTDSTSMDLNSQAVLQENRKLNEMIQRLFKEKQDLVTIIDKQKNTQYNISNQGGDNLNLNNLKERIERLEGVIDLQSEEILQWKQKYKQACEQDERAYAIEQMESQIMKVVEENERLNNLGNDKDKQIQDLSNELITMQKKLQEQEQKMKDQSNLIIAYEEDTKELKRQYKQKLNLIEKLEQQQQQQLQQIHQLQQIQNYSEISSHSSFHENRDHSQIILEQIQFLEQTLSELSTQYTSQTLENQRLLRQNNNLKEELILQQKALDEIRNSCRGAVNPKFQDANKSLKQIKEKIAKSQQK
ncbi:unnamed protein product [Paramecium primaurelia]|uniref:Uncharacterized protein n=1 Tax=Paramecium primaurelia TaxID=5886 RepID=A0A8S1NSI8_PARPR|nr:unnamed protein product [Paramecium primaurelia]